MCKNCNHRSWEGRPTFVSAGRYLQTQICKVCGLLRKRIACDLDPRATYPKRWEYVAGATVLWSHGKYR